jgi:hypothetical protein
MMALMFAVPIGIWLAISSVIYTLLWMGFIHRYGMVGISLVNLGLSAILSPGLVTGGHGALPFPGGALVLLGGTRDSSEAFPSFNFQMWVLTFVVFSVYSFYLKKSDTSD